MPGSSDLSPAETERLTQKSVRLAQFTVGYNIVEGAVAITAGLLAGLVSLVGFGFDSGIESASAVLVGLRLAARLRRGEPDEAKERRTQGRRHHLLRARRIRDHRRNPLVAAGQA